MMGRGAGFSYRKLTFCVEYEVPGDLDGASLPPSSNLLKSSADPQRIFRPPVPGNLGIIDPDLTVNNEDYFGTRGNRYVPWLWLDSPVPGNPGASLDLVDVVDGTAVVQKQIKDLSGLSTFFLDSGVFIPQGSALRIGGFTNPGGAKFKIRLGIIPLLNEEVLDALFISATSGSSPPSPSGGGAFIQEFGSSALSGTGAGVRYLWPGSSRSASQTQLVQVPIPVASTLTGFMLKQGRPPGSGTANVTYTVLLNAVATAATLTVPVVDGSVQSISGLTIPVVSGDQLSIQTTRSATHATVRDIVGAVTLEPT